MYSKRLLSFPKELRFHNSHNNTLKDIIYGGNTSSFYIYSPKKIRVETLYIYKNLIESLSVAVCVRVCMCVLNVYRITQFRHIKNNTPNTSLQIRVVSTREQQALRRAAIYSSCRNLLYSVAGVACTMHSSHSMLQVMHFPTQTKRRRTNVYSNFLLCNMHW